MHETCLNVELSVSSSIKAASQFLNISCCEIAKLLIMKAGSLDSSVVRNRLVEYQESGITISYKCFRYRLSEEERRCFSKFRCDLGISISKLLLVGFLLFFDEIISRLFGKEGFTALKNNFTIIKRRLYSSIEEYLISMGFVKESPG